MFKKPEVPIGATPLPSPVATAGGVLQFYSYIMDMTIQFEAFLTGYSDSFASNWASEPVYGRMDPIHTFQNTQRTMQLSFTVPNVVVSKGNYVAVSTTMNAVNRFFQFLYPKYSEAGGCNALTIKQAPLVRVKFGNMIARTVSTSLSSAKADGLLAAITALSMTPKIEHGFSKFSTERKGEFGSPTILIYPNFIDFSLSYNVIHEQGRFGSPQLQTEAQLAYIEEFGVLDPGVWQRDLVESYPYGPFADIVTGPVDQAFLAEREFVGTGIVGWGGGIPEAGDWGPLTADQAAIIEGVEEEVEIFDEEG